MKKFSELEYVRLDYEQIKKHIKEVTKKIKGAKSYDEFNAAFNEAENIIMTNLEAANIVRIRHEVNMADKYYDDENKYIAEQSESVNLAMVSLYKALLKSKFRKQFDEEYGDFLTKKTEQSLKLVNLFTLSDSIKESKTADGYLKLIAKSKCNFKGEECNFSALQKHMQSIDRQERKQAFDAWANLLESDAKEADEIYDKLVKIRVKKAKKLGFKNYIDYAYLNRSRFDYKPEDVAEFRNAVRDIIVPVCTELFNKQKQRLGIDKIHYYDEALVFPEGNATPIGSQEELVAKAKKMYHELSPETDEYFTFMSDYELFDLPTRQNKRVGGYCTFMPLEKAPFIFSNFNGTSADVEVLTHEAGHAFQCYVTSRHQKTLLSLTSTMDINETHSTSMVHFTYPWMDLFFGDKADKYIYQNLCSSLCNIPYVCAVDEFQHRVFENPKMTSSERRVVWHELETKYLPWRDYDGNKFLSDGGFWIDKRHIFMWPFYFIDYALAQVCAYQFYIRSITSRKEAWDSYLAFCRRGGSLGYFDLLKSANLNSPFKKETIQNITDEVVKIIKEYEEKI